MEEEFKVSKTLLKSMLVETRANILKALQERQMTASELSRALNKHVTTIAEHLDYLKGSNLVERVERPGRKWVYYRLTKSGQVVLSPKPYQKIVFMLAISFLTLFLGIFSLQFQSLGQIGVLAGQFDTSAAKSTTEVVPQAQPVVQSPQPFDIPLYLLSGSLITISLISLALTIRQIKKSYSNNILE